MVKILGREIPNKIEELTIEQFEAITDINNNKELDPVDRHLQIFEYLGIPEKEFFDFDISDFIDIVKELNKRRITDLSVLNKGKMKEILKKLDYNIYCNKINMVYHQRSHSLTYYDQHSLDLE